MQATHFSPPYLRGLVAGQGGHLAAIMRGPVVAGIEQPAYALIVSDAKAGEVKAPWGNYGTEIPGAHSRSDGKANTEAMVAAHCPAALQVRAMTIDGHSDWYLPSLGELNSAAANVPELFNKSGWYWTSTQGSRTGAFVQGFEDGYSYWDDKDDEHRVRAFRRIPLELLNA